MLCLSRKTDELLLIGEVIVKVVEIRGDKVRLGIVADKEVSIVRDELLPDHLREEARRKVTDSCKHPKKLG